MNDFEVAREKYRPEIINILFVGETPPKLTSKRFFYFENVDKYDSLFLETMKFLYPDETSNVHPKTIRKNKKYFLEKFKDDGCFLIDSLDNPFEKKFSNKKKENLLKVGQKSLLQKVRKLSSEQTKVILIAAPVFTANFSYLVSNGINVINNYMIDFPGSGGQINFQKKMAALFSQNE